MYLAPLNYDRYFKKVFSEKRIAKRFLEDFFDVEIEEIELLPTYHKITDSSTAVEFDFRCKISGSYIIIDMQQWYKPDITKRFYMYHAMNTVLQLEKIPDKTIDLRLNRKRDAKDYDKLLPVITMIWMVDDTMGFNDDFVSYTMTPEGILDFIRSKNLWGNRNIIALFREREKHLKMINNNARRLDYLQQNRLIYIFQKNIIKNKKYRKYLPWFQLAEKTLDRLNKKSWFDPYRKDKIFAEIIKRIRKVNLKEDDYTYIDNIEQFWERVKRYEDALLKEGREEGKVEGEKIGVEKGMEIGKKKGMKEILINFAKKCLQKGMNTEDTAELTGLPIKEIKLLFPEK